MICLGLAVNLSSSGNYLIYYFVQSLASYLRGRFFIVVLEYVLWLLQNRDSKYWNGQWLSWIFTVESRYTEEIDLYHCLMIVLLALMWCVLVK